MWHSGVVRTPSGHSGQCGADSSAKQCKTPLRLLNGEADHVHEACSDWGLILKGSTGAWWMCTAFDYMGHGMRPCAVCTRMPDRDQLGIWERTLMSTVDAHRMRGQVTHVKVRTE